MKHPVITVLVALSIALAFGGRVDAWVPGPIFGKLSEAGIVYLSRLAAKPAGVKQVGEILGKRNLPQHVLEDTWMRIAIDQEKISRTDAKKMFDRLSGVPGFLTNLRKICGNNPSGTIGHLNELEIAHTAVKHGAKVHGIGLRFVDPAISGVTDIDIVLEQRGKIFAIEAKKYSTGPLPMDSFRADMDTLVEYRKNSGNGRVIPVFSITQVSRDIDLRILAAEARKRNVQLVTGTPEEQVLQILHLSRIM